MWKSRFSALIRKLDDFTKIRAALNQWVEEASTLSLRWCFHTGNTLQSRLAWGCMETERKAFLHVDAVTETNRGLELLVSGGC